MEEKFVFLIHSRAPQFLFNIHCRLVKVCSNGGSMTIRSVRIHLWSFGLLFCGRGLGVRGFWILGRVLGTNIIIMESNGKC